MIKSFSVIVLILVFIGHQLLKKIDVLRWLLSKPCLRHVSNSVIIRNVLAPAVEQTIPLQPAPKHLGELNQVYGPYHPTPSV